MGKRTRIREKRQKQPQRNRSLLIGGIAVAAIAIAVVLILLSSGVFSARANDRPNSAGMAMGDPGAPVRVEEYSDFQCPFCNQFATQFEPGIVEKYIKTGQVHFTYIPYSFLGAESVRAAEAAYCAADQNKFWQFHDLLFRNQGRENSGVYSDTNLVRFAQQSGLTMTEFRACFDTGKYTDQVQADFNNGRERGVTGTPTFYINGEGPVDMRGLEAAIQNALNASN